MGIEYFNELYEYFHPIYCLLILLGVEFLKIFLVRLNSGKYVFIFDKEQIIRFNLRVAIVVISLLYGLIIVAFERNSENIFSLIITFCITTTFYDYIYKQANCLPITRITRFLREILRDKNKKL
jgi:hypothetical protein